MENIRDPAGRKESVEELLKKAQRLFREESAAYKTKIASMATLKKKRRPKGAPGGMDDLAQTTTTSSATKSASLC